MTKEKKQPLDLESLEEHIRDHRRACEKFLKERARRLGSIEKRLVGHLENVSEQLSGWEEFQARVQDQQLELEKDREEIERHRAQLSDESADLENKRHQGSVQRKRVAQRLSHARQALKNADPDQELLSTIESLQTDLEKQTELRQQLEAERDEIGDQLENQQARCNRLEADSRSVKDELVAMRTEERDLRKRVVEGRRLLDRRAAEVKKLREQLDSAGSQSDSEELTTLREERDRMAEELEALKQQLHQTTNNEDAAAELEDLRRQFEMAVEDVRKYREANEQLERKLQQVGGENGAGSDWERRKKKLLEQLENGEEPSADVEEDEQVAIGDAVRMTDEIVARKDSEIAELQSKLQQLTGQLAQSESDQTQLADMGDDERVQLEQQRLKKLQEEWREKLRAAEVDIAVQRAEYARQRAELDEKARDIEAQLALAKKQVAINKAKDTQTEKRGWLSRRK